VRNDFALHRVSVHVVQFLLHFSIAPHVEIVEASLPERRAIGREEAKGSDSYAEDGFLGRLRKPRVAPTQHLWRYNSRQS
jgi:hypothetical protein